MRKIDQRWRAACAAVLLFGAVRVFAVSGVQLRYAPLRLTGAELADEGDVQLHIEVDAPMEVWIYAAETADDPEGRPIGKLPATVRGALLWTDRGALDAVTTRYYWVLTHEYLEPRPRDNEWALFVQPREPGHKYLVSVPVDFGADNRLDARLGDQLARGLRAGDATNTADRLRVMNAEGRWQSYYLLADRHGNRTWRDPRSDTRARIAIEPGDAFWIERRAAAGATAGKGVFLGPTLPERRVRKTFRAGEDAVTPFGVPYSRPLRHRNTEAEKKYSTPPNPLGFARVGNGGTTSDHRRASERGDAIWVWRDNEWAERYWLMDRVGPKWDGRWWDDRTRDFADFALEPGRGYYYLHRTNRWGGSAFTWEPPVPGS